MNRFLVAILCFLWIPITWAENPSGYEPFDALECKEFTGALTPVADRAYLYCKDVNGVTKIFFKDSAGNDFTFPGETGSYTMTSSIDMSAAKVELPNSAIPPSTDCDEAGEVGRIYLDTDAPSGQWLYACEGVSGWKLQGDGGGARGGDSITVNASDATDPDFQNGTGINWSLTGGNVIKAAPSCIVVGASDNAGRTASHYFGVPGGAGATSSTILNSAPMPFAGTAKTLYASVNTAPGGTASWTVTVTKNSSTTVLGGSAADDCVISGTGTSCNDVSDSFTFAAGDRLGCQFIEGGAASGTGTSGCSFCVIPD